MINGASVTLAGFVATEPVFRTINDTTRKVSLRVAWTSRYRDKVTGEWHDTKTSFANVSCWRGMAHNVVPSLRKGEPIVVTGRLAVREYQDKDGRPRTFVDIEADAIGHDLSRGITHFQRTARAAAEEMSQHHQGELPDGGGLAGAGPAELVDDAGELGGILDQDAVDALAATTAAA